MARRSLLSRILSALLSLTLLGTSLSLPAWAIPSSPATVASYRGFTEQAITPGLLFMEALRSFFQRLTVAGIQQAGQLVRTWPTDVTDVTFKPSELLATYDRQYSVLGDAHTEPTTMTLQHGRMTLENTPLTDKAEFLKEWFASALTVHLPTSQFPNLQQALKTQLLHPIHDALSQPGISPRLIVSRDPNLIQAQIPFVEFVQDGHWVIAMNGAWADQVYAVWRSGTEEDRLALSVWLPEKLEHPFTHISGPAGDPSKEHPIAWYVEEARATLVSAQRADALQKPEIGYQPIMDGLFERHPELHEKGRQTIATGRFYNTRDGIFKQIMQKGSSFLFEFVQTLSGGPKVRTFPVADVYQVNDFRAFQGSHPTLYRLKEVRPAMVLRGKRAGTQGDQSTNRQKVSSIEVALIEGQLRAAVEAWQFRAQAFPIRDFAHQVAAEATTGWLNTLPTYMVTQAAEATQSISSTVSGYYGFKQVLGWGSQSDPDVLLVMDPIDGGRALEDPKTKISGINLASYAIKEDFQNSNRPMPTLRLDDRLYMLYVAGPKNSGVSVDISQKRWVEENMRRVATKLGKSIQQVHVAPIGVRKRHLQLINDSLRVLQISWEEVNKQAPHLAPYFKKESGVAVLSDPKGIREALKTHMNGVAVLRNPSGGSITLVPDAEPMTGFDLADFAADGKKADIAFGARGAAERVLQARSVYDHIDLEARVISYLATEEGSDQTLQAIDPEARNLRVGRNSWGTEINEPQIATSAGTVLRTGFWGRLYLIIRWLRIIPIPKKIKSWLIKNTTYRVARTFTLDDLTGGPTTLTVAVNIAGQAASHVEGFEPVKLSEDAHHIEVTALIVRTDGETVLQTFVFETQLATLQHTLDSTSDPAEQVKTLLAMGRLYGDLQRFSDATQRFDQARRLATSSAQIERLDGLEFYYRGLQQLLGAAPDLDMAKHFFGIAADHLYPPGQRLKEAIEASEQGKPLLSTTPRLSILIDGLAKAGEEARSRIFVQILRYIATTLNFEDLEIIRLYISTVRYLAKRLCGSPDPYVMIEKVIEAALSNPTFGYEFFLDLKSLAHSSNEFLSSIAHKAMATFKRPLGQPVTVSIEITSTGYRLTLADQHGITNDPRHTRGTYWKDVATDEKEDPGRVVHSIARAALELLADNAVDLKNVQRIGVAISGTVDSQGLVTSINMPIPFEKYAIAPQLQKDLEILSSHQLSSIQVDVLNNAVAHLYGERYDERGQIRKGMTIFLLLGDSGIGGATLDENGQLDPTRSEFGHTLITLGNTDEEVYEFEYRPLDRLREQGYFDGTNFQSIGDREPRAQYFERSCGAPWAAYYLAHSIESGLGDYRFRAYYKSLGLTEEDLRPLLELRRFPRESWAKHADPVVVDKVLRGVLPGLDYEQFYSSTYDNLRESIDEARRDFMFYLTRSVMALHEANPRYQIIIGGSLAEIIGNIPELRNKLTSIPGVEFSDLRSQGPAAAFPPTPPQHHESKPPHGEGGAA